MFCRIMFVTLLVIMIFINQNLAKASDCSQILAIDELSPNGSFSSPDWPKPYQPNKNCTWTISSVSGTYIKLTLTYFDLQYDHLCSDRVLIRPGNEAGTKLCAYSIDVPFVAYSTNNHFNVHFIADGTTTSNSSGFKAEFAALQATCRESNLNGLSGRISSPNFPDYYPPNMFCEHNIMVPLGYQIELNFSTFDLEDAFNCTADYVSVEDLFDPDTTALVLCGMATDVSKMPSFRSKGRAMLVTFFSDDSYIRMGFEAKFKAIQNTPHSNHVVLTTNTVLPSQRRTTLISTTPALLFATRLSGITKSATTELVEPSATLTTNAGATPEPTTTPQLTDPDLIAGAYRSIPNHTIRGFSVKNLSASSEIVCVFHCQQSSMCKSVTYSQFPGLCTLHNTNRHETPESFEAKSHVMHYELITRDLSE